MEKEIQQFVPNMKISKSGVLKPGMYQAYEQNGIEILQDNILLDFTGVVIAGGKDSALDYEAKSGLHEEFSYDDNTDEESRVAKLGFFGIGLKLCGRKNVTIKGLTLKGFELAVSVTDCENITLEDCNFSDNFHDPECGWNEHGAKGAIYLESSHRCTIKNNRANNVWNGIYLRRSDYNLIINNDFSYASNMCVKLWNACSNTIDSNNLSWGLRIKPGEVHARDSAGMLIESGSDFNIVRNNDLTHGGDGLFLRVLNGWHSRFNLFENNDCSYANNNAIEAWADSNTYIRNKANHSSYGFWMGGSDNTIMFENEACFNGKLFSNAPESFGNCGVAVVNGSGHNFYMSGNKVCSNNGPGMAIRFEKRYPIFHWVIEDNIICQNSNCGQYTGHGIYIKNAGLISISNNIIEENDGEPIFCDENVFDIIKLQNGDDFVSLSPTFPESFARQGEPLHFSCEASCQSGEDVFVRWDFGDGTASDQVDTAKTYDDCGTFYAGVTASSKSRSAIKGTILNIIPRGVELSPMIEAASLKSDDPNALLSFMREAISCRSDECRSFNLSVKLSQRVLIEDNTHISFFLKLISDAETDWDKSLKSPVITLIQDEQNKLVLTPKLMTADGLFVEKTWEKFEYRFISVPIKESDDSFDVVAVGSPTAFTEMTIDLQYKNSGRAYMELKGSTLHTAARENALCSISSNDFPELIEYPKMTCSQSKTASPENILSPKNIYLSDGTKRFVAADEQSFIIVDLGKPSPMHGVEFVPYQSSFTTAFSHDECFPKAVSVFIGNEDGGWEKAAFSDNISSGCNRLEFKAVTSQRLKLELTGKSCSIRKLDIIGEKPLNRTPTDTPVKLKELLFKTHIEANGSLATLSDMLVHIYRTEDKKPVGEPLYTAELCKQEIKSGKIQRLSFKELFLEHGEYCVAFSQKELAKSRTEGAYYRFPAAKQPFNEASGVLTGGEYKDETGIWGNLWIYLVTDNGVIDFTNESEGLGVRAGFTDSVQRYQTFTLRQS